MALISCPECKKQISETVESCPKCGYKLTPEQVAAIKKQSTAVQTGCAIALLVVVLPIMFAICTSSQKSTETGKTETRQGRIERQFSAWDGSHYKLTRRIKASMHDPKSYDHVKTTYVDHGSYLIVTATFRGKNAFGGTVLNSVTAKVDLSGVVLEMLKE